MEKKLLEQVFTVSGIPTYTYVQPAEYNELVVAVRTPGKCIVIEGPSGIGKTTAIMKTLDKLGLSDQVKVYSARKPSDREPIKKIANGDFEGIAIIDDFHKLDPTLQEKTSDLMKVLADEGECSRKVIIIGINKVGNSLVTFSPDLNNRISTIRFEANSIDRIKILIAQGETALKISIKCKNEIAEHAFGSFHLAQLLCQKLCTIEGVLEEQDELFCIQKSYNVVENSLIEDFSRLYYNAAKDLATGKRLRRSGRAPYVHILKWLAENNSWSISIRHELTKHPNEKASVSQVINKGYFGKFLSSKPYFQDYVHFDLTTETLSVEDPKFMYYLKSLNWNSFALSVGYLQFVVEPRYDFALSFAGADRDVAKMIAQRLMGLDIAVFYDKNEQSDIVSQDVEDYLTPICTRHYFKHLPSIITYRHDLMES